MTSGAFNTVCFKNRKDSASTNPVVIMHREANKVFLEVLKPFSSEKGFKPPEALVGKGEEK